MKCPKCSKEYDDSLAFCPHCAEPTPDLTQATQFAPPPEEDIRSMPPPEEEEIVPAEMGAIAEIKPRRFSRKTKVLIGILITLLVIGPLWQFIYGLIDRISGGYRPTWTISTSASVNNSNMTFTNENWNEACSNPSGFHGAKVEGLFGKIFAAPNVIKGGAIVVLPMYADTDVLPMYADTDNPEQATIVYYLGSNSSHSSQFAYGDLIKVNGKLVGEFKGKNRMGKPITGPTIEAASVTKTDVTALMQGGKYVTVKQHQDQNGVVITVDKMVLRDNETDVFIRVKNNQPSQTAYFFGYPYHAMLQVGNQQFNEDILKENLYGQIPSDILPGVEVQGILAFPAIGTPVPSTGVVSLRLEASSQNYKTRFNPYVFNISW